jgi:hypothetical protein
MNCLVASMPQERGHGWPVKCLPRTEQRIPIVQYQSAISRCNSVRIRNHPWLLRQRSACRKVEDYIVRCYSSSHRQHARGRADDNAHQPR